MALNGLSIALRCSETEKGKVMKKLNRSEYRALLERDKKAIERAHGKMQDDLRLAEKNLPKRDFDRLIRELPVLPIWADGR